MRIIIVTGRFGMGHMTAALAIKQQIDSSRIKAHVEVIDWLDSLSPKFADKYYKFFNFLVNKGSKLYNTRYRFMENRKTDQKPELFSFFLRCFIRLLDEKKPDLIISTLPFCSQVISRYKEETGSFLPLITCVTDITGHSEWINKNTNFYFVGSQAVTDKFISKGVSPDRIIETGLPVRLDFLNTALDDYRGKCNNVRRILIMGGGLGMLPKGSDFYKGLELLPNTEVTVITGKNHSLYERLAGKYTNFTVLGYVQNVYDYMKQADVIITKPGGITTFEAIYAGVPIIALNPSLQQELYNAQYIQEMGIGTVIYGNNKQCIELIVRMLDSRQLNYHRNNIQKLKSQLNIYKLIQILEVALYEGHPERKVGLKTNIHSIREDQSVNETISFNI